MSSKKSMKSESEGEMEKVKKNEKTTPPTVEGKGKPRARGREQAGQHTYRTTSPMDKQKNKSGNRVALASSLGERAPNGADRRGDAPRRAGLRDQCWNEATGKARSGEAIARRDELGGGGWIEQESKWKKRKRQAALNAAGGGGEVAAREAGAQALASVPVARLPSRLANLMDFWVRTDGDGGEARGGEARGGGRAQMGSQMGSAVFEIKLSGAKRPPPSNIEGSELEVSSESEVEAAAREARSVADTVRAKAEGWPQLLKGHADATEGIRKWETLSAVMRGDAALASALDASAEEAATARVARVASAADLELAIALSLSEAESAVSSSSCAAASWSRSAQTRSRGHVAPWGAGPCDGRLGGVGRGEAAGGRRAGGAACMRVDFPTTSDVPHPGCGRGATHVKANLRLRPRMAEGAASAIALFLVLSLLDPTEVTHAELMARQGVAPGHTGTFSGTCQRGWCQQACQISEHIGRRSEVQKYTTLHAGGRRRARQARRQDAPGLGLAARRDARRPAASR